MPKTVDGEGYRDFSEPRFFECESLAQVTMIRAPVDKSHAIVAPATGSAAEVWKFDTSSDETADGWNIVNPLNPAITGQWRRLGSVVNPVLFGADPTGTLDSAPAFQAAMRVLQAAGGGLLDIPKGTFLLETLATGLGNGQPDDRVFVPLCSNLWVRGAGMGATTLKVGDNIDSATWGVLSYYTNSGAALTDITITDLSVNLNGTNNLTANGANPYNNAIHISACERVFVSRLYVYDAPGVQCFSFTRPTPPGRTCHYVTITDCQFYNCGSAAASGTNVYQLDHSAIYIDGDYPLTDRNRFFNSALPPSTVSAIELHSSYGVASENLGDKFAYGTIVASAGADVKDVSISRNIFTNCYVGHYNYGAAGFDISDMDITGNHWHATDYSGTSQGSTVLPVLDLANQMQSGSTSNRIRITGNVIDATSMNTSLVSLAFGCQIGNIADCVFEDNTVLNTVRIGLGFGGFTDGVPVVRVLRNRFINCGRGAGVAPAAVYFTNSLGNDFKSVHLVGNIFRNDGGSTSSQAFGFGTDVTRAVVSDNDINGYANGAAFGSTVFGSLQMSYLQGAPVTVTGTTTLTTSDGVLLCNTTSAGFTVNLPIASTVRGKTYVIKKISSDGNTLTLDANGSETIDGALTQTTTTQWNTWRVQSSGTAWFLV